MKQKKFVLLLLLLLRGLPGTIFAQQEDAFQKMKAGDWFEVLVADTARKPADESYRYNIRYLLKKTDASGNREYTLTFERIRIILSHPGIVALGYDSYYPPYRQGMEKPDQKPVFQSRVDPKGKILSMKPGAEFSRINLYEIGTRSTNVGRWVELEPIHKETATVISAIIMKAIANREQDWYSGTLYRNSGLSFVLSAASFPLKPNVLIEGHIKNMTAELAGEYALYLPGVEKAFRISADGSFRMAFFLSEGSGARLRNRHRLEKTPAKPHSGTMKDVDVVLAMRTVDIPLFFRPGDTLRITGDALDPEGSLQFSGNTAKMAAFGLDIAKATLKKNTPEIPYGVKLYSAETFMKQQDADRAIFDRLNKTYSGQLSPVTGNYYRLWFAFTQASERLDFLSKTSYKSSPASTRMFDGFPEHFFEAVDTLPVMMTDYNNAVWYTDFINTFQFYLSAKVGQLNGGSSGFFLGDYVLSLNHLRCFPLYLTLADAFENQLGNNSWKTAQTLKPYYEDFINNCADTVLTGLVRQKWETLSLWAPGKPIPLKSIKLADGGLLNMNRFKGKVLNITFNFHYPDEMRRLLERIKKQDPQKVHFLIVQLKEHSYPPSSVVSELKKLSQVTFVEVAPDNQALRELVMLENFDIKTFVMDSDLGIIQDNINDSPDELPKDKNFEEAVQKALEPKKMSRQEKAELIKITLWSLGSIMFAGLGFLWIYRARVSAIRRKESLKRRIQELEIRAIRSQMNPHFMFNALNSIQSLINGHQYKEANIYLEKFSYLMRMVLNNSEKTFVSLSDELEAVSLYAELEKLRFDFEFGLYIGAEINSELIEIPGMIIQPLVENAILHGIAQKGASGLLAIRVSRVGIYLRVEVTDNGTGWTEKEGRKPSGFGLKLVRERLHLLNVHGGIGKLEIIPNLGIHAEGVTAVLSIPLD
ncbi:sensor histidine kinase [Arcticibacter tournemirensis]|nr:histidine kinase [Arcticibacter tournemirensis]